MNEVFYRKWRPKILGDVVGQEPITRTLRQAVNLDRIAHAYLFCGPRGTGKTSTARILAKSVNLSVCFRWACLARISQYCYPAVFKS